MLIQIKKLLFFGIVFSVVFFMNVEAKADHPAHGHDDDHEVHVDQGPSNAIDPITITTRNLNVNPTVSTLDGNEGFTGGSFDSFAWSEA